MPTKESTPYAVRHPTRRTLLGALAGLGTWPTTIQARRAEGTLVAPISAGTTMDLLARQAAHALRAGAVDFGVLNLPGGGGLPAAQRVLQSPDEEHTLLLSHAGLMCIVPLLLKDSVRFDPLADFTPLGILTRAPFVLYTSAAQPTGDLASLRARLGGSATPVSYSVLALYAGDHLSGAQLFRRLGIPATAVAYRQAGQALLDVAAGRVQFGVASWGNVQPLLRKGQVRVISALSRHRLPFAPDLPALDEAGLSDCAYEGWHGLFHRSSVPAGAFARQAQALQDWCSRPGYETALAELGYTPNPLRAEQAADFLRQEVTRHQALLRDLQLN